MCGHIGFEISHARADGVFDGILAGEGVGRFEAVASDAGDGQLIRPDAAMRVEAGGNGSRDTACCFGKDAFCFGQLLDPGDEFDVGYILSPAAAVADGT